MIVLIAAILLAIPLLAYVFQEMTMRHFKRPDGTRMPTAGLFAFFKGLFIKLNNLDTGNYRKYGKYGVFHNFLGPVSNLEVGGPEELKKLLMNPTKFRGLSPSSTTVFNEILQNALGITQDHDRWTAHRKLLNSSFTNTEKFLPCFERHIDHCFDAWEAKMKKGQNKFQVAEETGKIALDVLGEAVFGQDLKSVEGGNSELRYSYEKVMVYLFEPTDFIFPWLKSLPTKHNAILKESVANYLKGMKNIIKEAREKGPSNPPTMLDSLLENMDEDTMNDGFTEREIISNVSGFFVAGHETTASALALGLFSLCKYPEVRQKLIEEIDEVVGDKPLTMEVLSELKYTQMFINETQRRYSIIGTFPRFAVEDAELGGFHIPKGTMITANFTATHHDEKTWGDPFNFRPERFSKEESKNRHRFSFLPFSGGPHICLGMQFSLYEQRMFYAKLLRRFNVSMNQTDKIEYNNFGSLAKHIQMEITPRVK
ncbi:cytochrome P450 [Acrasis kona]|uniref:Cytochrome P450 n=1 Tax=Acrasis kona TaxID=1008807 RepID=A0AAW2YUI4_9EUKA